MLTDEKFALSDIYAPNGVKSVLQSRSKYDQNTAGNFLRASMHLNLDRRTPVRLLNRNMRVRTKKVLSGSGNVLKEIVHTLNVRLWSCGCTRHLVSLEITG